MSQHVMEQPPTMRQRADYGLDAPGVVRNLGIVATAGILSALAWLAGFWSLRSTLAPVLCAAIGLGTGCLFTALWMVWYSKVGKLRGRARLLGSLAWSGHETVLDVGCGRGLLLIEAARRLKTGKAVGVDIWQGQDLSGNRPEATLRNAQIEGVADRVEVKDGDARNLPFSDGTFDVVVYSAALHNIYDAAERQKAVREIVRVLKPGGSVLIRDIQHTAEYAQVLSASGIEAVSREGSPLAPFLACLTMGSLQPYVVTGKKR